MVIEGTASGPSRPGAQALSATARAQHPVFWMSPATTASTIPAIEAVPGGSARAILSEIEVCATRYAATGESAMIDLRFLKSMPDERATLARMLGRGEVQATVETLGRTEVQETAIPCVWWISHRNHEGETVGELIEIADIPEVMTGDRKAVIGGLDALRATWPAHGVKAPTIPPYPNAR